MHGHERRRFAVRTLGALALLASGARTASACSLAAPWAIRDRSMIAFIGTAGSDTVRAGPGLTRPQVAPGHSGDGQPRETYGQRVRIDQLGEQARRALPAGVREVVLVPWDFGADCAPVAWGRSARWLAPGVNGLFRARLRPVEHWAEGLPTFDLNTTSMQPYPQMLESVMLRRPRSAPPLRWMSAEALLRLYDSMPPRSDLPDSLAELAFARSLVADTAAAHLYPVTELLQLAKMTFEDARARATRIPVAGTFRIDASIDDGPWRTFFLRTRSGVTSLHSDLGGGSDTSLVPPVPYGYFVYASVSTSVDSLAPDCAGSRGRHFSYVELDWHAPVAADGNGAWTGGLDERIFEVLLPTEEVTAWRARSSAAMQARLDSARARGVEFEWIPNHTLRFVQAAGAPMRIEGETRVPELGRVRVRGERIAPATLACRW